MPITMTMPRLGESVVEGVILRWLKQEGDRIARDEPLLEVMTDKVNAELPSTEEGTLLRIIAQEGETVPVGAPIAELAVATEPAATAAGHNGAGAAPAPVAGARRPAPVSADVIERPAPAPSDISGGRDDTQRPRADGVQATGAEGGARRPYSPVVRRLARQYELDIETLAGTGLGGRVTKEDVLAYLAAHGQNAGHATQSTSGEAPAVAPSPPAPTQAPAPAVAAGRARSEPPTVGVDPESAAAVDGIAAAGAEDEILPLTPMRRAIADHMARSAREAPHATTVHEVDVTHLVKWREQHQGTFRARHGVDISILAFVVAAACGALRDVPILNSSWSEHGIVLKRQINVGIAVALQEGLIVPVIQRADELSLVGIARAIVDLAARAREGRLSPAEVRDGTFTISNVGMYGSILSVPVIHQPQAAILAVGAVTGRVVVLPDDALAIRSMLYLSLSFDHRSIDGMVACRFMQNLCTRLTDMNLESL